jgi:hypothetical protein
LLPYKSILHLARPPNVLARLPPNPGELHLSVLTVVRLGAQAKVGKQFNTPLKRKPPSGGIFSCSCALGVVRSQLRRGRAAVRSERSPGAKSRR